MVSIKQSVDVEFHAVDVKDILIVMPIMDDLESRINDLKSSIKESEKKLEENDKAYYCELYKNELKTLESQYTVLSSLGFLSTKSVTEI